MDFDFASDLDKYSLITRYLFSPVTNPISWRSILHFIVNLPTTEVKFMVVI